MKKHILGLAIFSFIVFSFVSIWTLLGYFTQTIPNIPKVESDSLPVFKTEKRRSCRMRGEKLSYVVSYSVYSVDSKTLSSTLKIKWNGYGSPPEKLYISQKLFTADNEEVFSGLEEAKAVNFDNYKRDIFVTYNVKIPLSESDLAENLYTDFTISDESGKKYNSSIERANQVIVSHGEKSVYRSKILKP